MSKNNIIIALVVLSLLGTIWGGAVQNKKSNNLERQLTAMKGQTPAAGEAISDKNKGKSDSALTEVEELTARNKVLLEGAATLKGSVASLEQEVADLKKELESASDSQTVETMQKELDKRADEVTKLEETAAALKADLDEKITALAAVEEAAAGLEEKKNGLADRVDAYSAKSQKLSAELEEADMRVDALEKAFEERTKLLAVNEEELSRTKLNMNVLLSKISAQKNSIAILEETRIALEQELANKFKIIEELQQQLSAQIVVEEVIEEELVEEVVVLEEKVAEAAAEEQKAAPVEE